MAKKEVETLENFKINEKEGFIVLPLKSKLYSLDIIYSAAYVFLDRAYVLLAGDPEKEILVELRLKQGKKDLRKLAREFNNELINYSVYKNQSEKAQDIRQRIVDKALETNSYAEDSEEEGDYIDDPLGIAKPWEEVYGKKDG